MTIFPVELTLPSTFVTNIGIIEIYNNELDFKISNSILYECNSFLSSNRLTSSDIGAPFGIAGLDQNASLNSNSIPNTVPLVINNKNTTNNSITLNLVDLGDVNATDDSNSLNKYLSFNGTSWVASNVTTTKSLIQLTKLKQRMILLQQENIYNLTVLHGLLHQLLKLIHFLN